MFWKRKLSSLADMMPWSNLIDSGTAITKHGHIVVGYYFRPPDNDSSTDEEAASLADQVNTALAVLGSGWSSWADVVSFPAGRYPPASASHFPDDLTRTIDDGRRERFEAAGAHYENDRAFFLAYLPPRHQVSKLGHLFFTEGGNRKRRATQQQVIDGVNKVLREFENRVGRALGLRRMASFRVEDNEGFTSDQDELINYLNYAATGRNHGIMLPRDGAYLDQVIAAQDVHIGENPVIGGDYIGVVAIDGFPAESQPNIISGLNTLALPYRFTQRMIYLDPHQAEAEIVKYRDKWGQQTRGIAAKLLNGVQGQGSDESLNEHALQMKREANTAIGWAKGGLVKFGYYSATVIVRHADSEVLREWCDQVSQVISGSGFNARIEETNTVDAWLGSLPGDTESNVRRPLIHTRFASELLPLSGVWTGSEEAPCPFYPEGSPALLWAITSGAIPFRLNLHIGPRSDVGHTLILGPTGQGKSTLTNVIAIQSRRYPGMIIWAFDYKRGMLATTLACGGMHFDLGNDAVTEDGLFCPLGTLDGPNDIEWAADYMAVLYELQTKLAPSPELRSAIFRAVVELSIVPEHLRSISNFVSALQDVDARSAFHHYTIEGAAGSFLDGSRDHISADNNFTTFETMDLMSLGDATALPVLLYQFRRFERSLRGGHPSLLFIAEAWQALGHPMWRDRLARWLRTLRSKNCAVVLDTQSLADVIGSPLLPLLNETCQRKIFLPNPAATQHGSYELYRSLGLNDRQVGMISHGTPKREYYVTGPDGYRMVSLGLGPLEMAIAGATGEPDVEAVRDAMRRHGGDWLRHFLAAKGVAYGAPAREQAYA